jgi:hypothetical protein
MHSFSSFKQTDRDWDDWMSEKISSLPNSIAPTHSIHHTLGWADEEERDGGGLRDETTRMSRHGLSFNEQILPQLQDPPTSVSWLNKCSRCGVPNYAFSNYI